MKTNIKYTLLFFLFFVLTDQLTGRFLLTGINRFYGLNQHSDLLIIGHSHLMLATNKAEIEKKSSLNEKKGVKVSKYTREGVNVIDRHEMVRQYLNDQYSDSLKVVLYGVDLFTFSEKGLSQNSYKLFYPFMETKSIDKFVKKSSPDARDYYTHKLIQLTRYSDALINASFRGWLNDFSNYKLGTLDVKQFKEDMSTGKSHFARDIVMKPELINTFEKTMDLLEQRGIKVILINTPVVDILNNFNKEDYKIVIDYYKSYAQTHENVDYWDFNPTYSSDYSIFYDPIHLNPKGQELITGEIIRKIDSLSLNSETDL